MQQGFRAIFALLGGTAKVEYDYVRLTILISAAAEAPQRAEPSGHCSFGLDWHIFCAFQRTFEGEPTTDNPEFVIGNLRIQPADHSDQRNSSW
jgi:hypothetical protein